MALTPTEPGSLYVWLQFEDEDDADDCWVRQVPIIGFSEALEPLVFGWGDDANRLVTAATLAMAMADDPDLNELQAWGIGASPYVFDRIGIAVSDRDEE